MLYCLCMETRVQILSMTSRRVRTVIKKYNSSIFQYNPGWIELNFQDICDAVSHKPTHIYA